MNIVNKLTVRHLKQNKKRTLVTILGTIISVAMVSAVATLGLSFMDMLQRNTIANSGEWHVAYEDVTKDQLGAIKQDDGTDDLILSKDLGFAKLEGSANESKPYLFIQEMNEIGYERFPLTLSLGRMPRAENEIVLSEEVAKNAGIYYEIGDTITLPIGDRVTEEEGYEDYDYLSQHNFLVWTSDGELGEELVNEINKEYEVVGIIERPEWEPAWGPAYTALAYVDEETMTTEDHVNGLVVLNDIGRSLYEDADALAEELGVNSISFNDELLRYYGLTTNDSMQATLYGLLSIIIAVIVVGSVALIFNAFAISVSERSRHLGMLSSVGATKRQKRNSVFFEGFIIGLISIPLGLIAGVVGIGITFFFINNTFIEATGAKEGLELIVTPTSLLIAAAISAVTIFISTYIPAIRASRITAIDAIRQTQDVKLTGKAVKHLSLLQSFLG
ncbi:ABC transporter permease [Bacillus sp. JCM 19041]|uniref:ABC transporter permease n=1 Tax=Bacillus sp. JCM 19041 TaxID=1460637 RepID=UPI000B18666C